MTSVEREPFAVLCFGGSNTWGRVAATNHRYKRHGRWPGALQSRLGPEFYVVEEGLAERTAVWHDPLESDVSAQDHLPMCLASHHPIDLVILMLGTADLKQRFNLTSSTIASGVARLGKTVLDTEAWEGAGSPQLLILAPPTLGPRAEDNLEYLGGRPKSQDLPGHLRVEADRLRCQFFDTNEIVAVSERDGIHLDLAAHTTLGHHVATLVRQAAATPESPRQPHNAE